MDFEALLNLLKSRRSVRKFTARRPSREQIARLVEAACWAPSNHNRQGWKFIVFQDKARIEGLAGDVRRSLERTLAGAPRLLAEWGDELLHFATAFAAAPAVVLAMHKRSPAVGRALLAASGNPCASGEALSTAMAVQNLLLAAHAMGLAACVMTGPVLAGDVWSGLGDLPPGFEPTCLVAIGYPAEQPEPPRRKPLDQVLEYR